MGLMDSLGGMLGNAMGQQGANALEGLLGQAGGLEGIVQQLNNAGLGQQVNSWLGNGENMPLTAAEITQALDPAHLQHYASLMGIDINQAAAHLAQHLPNVLDQASPNGTLPAGLGNLFG